MDCQSLLSDIMKTFLATQPKLSCQFLTVEKTQDDTDVISAQMRFIIDLNKMLVIHEARTGRPPNLCSVDFQTHVLNPFLLKIPHVYGKIEICFKLAH
jgi:hypothetical protein